VPLDEDQDETGRPPLGRETIRRFDAVSILADVKVDHALSKSLSPPDHLDLNLRGIISLWRGLKRAENSMPFADDLELSALSDLP